MAGTAGEISNTGARYYAEPRTHPRHVEDFYIEPGWAVDLLLGTEAFTGGLWDPACGSGTIVTTAIARGLTAVGTDIADRGFGSQHDFLSEFAPLPFGGVANIVCNPPYRVAGDFIERALTVASRKVAMLVQAKFPYSQRRHALFTTAPPARLYFLSTRPSMPPGEKLLAGTLEAKGGKLDYLWMVWDREHQGPTECRWLKRAASP
jgi:hypothetical protein